jgi:excisionase family DNA binding protein
LYLRFTSGGGKEATMRTGARFADAATDLPALMDMDRARELLGMSRSAVYRAAAAGHLPTLRFGRRVYVPTARLLAMLGIDAEEEP